MGYLRNTVSTVRATTTAATRMESLRSSAGNERAKTSDLWRPWRRCPLRERVTTGVTPEMAERLEGFPPSGRNRRCRTRCRVVLKLGFTPLHEDIRLALATAALSGCLWISSSCRSFRWHGNSVAPVCIRELDQTLRRSPSMPNGDPFLPSSGLRLS